VTLEIGKLGRVEPASDDVRTRSRLARALPASALIPPRSYPAGPPDRDYLGDEDYPWFLNDRLGCCTITGIAHYLVAAARQRGVTITITDDDIRTAYSRATGYIPGRPETDRGGQCINALVVARNEGIGGHKIGGFARVDMTDKLQVEAMINLTGPLFVGSDLPKRIESQPDEWFRPPLEERTVADKPRSLGGHAYLYGGYNHRKIKALPWRKRVDQRWDWSFSYTDEGWALFDKHWVDGDCPTPSGFPLERLRQYLASL
jgi:hypothetical protein